MRFRSAANVAPVPRKPTGRLLLDDIALHRTERAEELALFLLADLELVEGLREVLHERREVSRTDAHALVGVLHALALVLAGAAARLADLVDQIVLERCEPLGVGRCLGEEALDPVVGGAVPDELADNRRDALLP